MGAFNDYGDIIRQRREEMGLSIEKLARQSLISPHLLSEAENDRYALTESELIFVANALGLSAEALKSGHTLVRSGEELSKKINELEAVTDSLKNALNDISQILKEFTPTTLTNSNTQTQDFPQQNPSREYGANKYEFTDETITFFDYINGSPIILHRIVALYDFNDVKAGDLGGFVESEFNLSQFGLSWVYDDAKVINSSRVYDDVQVRGEAIVRGQAIISERAVIDGNADVSGSARVFGHAEVFGSARIMGNSQVHGFSEIKGNAIITDNAVVSQYAQIGELAIISKDAHVYGEATVFGRAEVFGNARIYGEASVFGEAEVYGSAKVFGFAKICKNARVYGLTEISGYMQIDRDYTSENQEPADARQVDDDYIDDIQEKKAMPDRYLTGLKIKTPRGEFSVTDRTKEEMEAAGYGYHHESDDGQYIIMGGYNRAFAIRNTDNDLKKYRVEYISSSVGQINGTESHDEISETIGYDFYAKTPKGAMLDATDFLAREVQQNFNDEGNYFTEFINEISFNVFDVNGELHSRITIVSAFDMSDPMQTKYEAAELFKTSETKSTEKKYELTDKTVIEKDDNGNEHTLYQIKALRDFGNVKAGTLGGYIESENNLSHDGEAWVAAHAKVFENAYIYDNGYAMGGARVYGNAQVCEDAVVHGESVIKDNAKVFGSAEVNGSAIAKDDMQVNYDLVSITASTQKKENAKENVSVQEQEKKEKIAEQQKAIEQDEPEKEISGLAM